MSSSSGLSCLGRDNPESCYNRPPEETGNSNKRCTLDRCTLSTSPILLQGLLTNQTKLPSNAFDGPAPDTTKHSCTVSSITKPVAWRFTYFRFTTRWISEWPPNVAYTNGVIRIRNSALDPSGDDWFIDPSGSALTPYQPSTDPSIKYMNFPGTFWKGYDATARLDLATGYFEGTSSWYCEDKDTVKP
jgi:hypothetical protein